MNLRLTFDERADVRTAAKCMPLSSITWRWWSRLATDARNTSTWTPQLLLFSCNLRHHDIPFLHLPPSHNYLKRYTIHAEPAWTPPHASQLARCRSGQYVAKHRQSQKALQNLKAEEIRKRSSLCQSLGWSFLVLGDHGTIDLSGLWLHVWV